MMSRVLERTGKHWVRWTTTFLVVATFWQVASGRAAEDAAASGAQSEKMSDAWSRTLPVSDPPDPTFGEWRVWAQEGWLLAERRTGDEVEWKIVLARLVGDELPKIDVNRPQAVRKSNGKAGVLPGPAGPMPGALRLSYRDGRYFIRDGFGSLRCLRELKTDERPWPKLELPPRDAQAKFGRMVAPQLGPVTSDSWIVVHAGPPRGMQNITADCLLRLTHQNLIEGGTKLTNRPGVRRLTCGNWFVVDDGELLVAERLETRQLAREIERRERMARLIAANKARRRMLGSPAPEFSDGTWLNAERPPTWEALRGKPVLLVWFDLKQPAFLPLVGPLLAVQETYREQGLAVIGVCANGPRDEMEKRLAAERIKFPVLIDDSKTGQRYGAGFCSCLLIDRQGKVASVQKDLLVPPAEIEKLLDAADGK